MINITSIISFITKILIVEVLLEVVAVTNKANTIQPRKKVYKDKIRMRWMSSKQIQGIGSVS